MIFSGKSDRLHHPPLLMNNTMLTEADTHRHLGLTLSNTCTWSEHIQTISTKACARLNLLRALKFWIIRKSLEKCTSLWYVPYNSIVTPFGTMPQTTRTIHIEAARIITGATKRCNIALLLYGLGCELLQDRGNKHKLIIFYKIIHDLTPTYLRDLVPPLIQETTDYNLSNANDIRILHAYTHLYFNSFFPSKIQALNSLPEETKQAPSVASFKHHLNRDINKPPIYFNAGMRKG